MIRENIADLYYGILLHTYITGLYYGIALWNYIMGLYCGIIIRNDILRDCITGSYHGIVSRNYPVKRNPGTPETSPEPPWDPGDSLGTPLGPPGDAPGTLGDPQIHIARSFRLLHPNPFVATDRPKESPAPFRHVSYEIGAPFGRPQGRPGGASSCQEGACPQAPMARLPFVYQIYVRGRPYY